MPSVNSGKVLRVGVIQNGRILYDRIFKTPRTVFIGDSARVHFVVFSPLVGSRFPLFSFNSGCYELNLTDKMGGKIFISGENRDVSDLIKLGLNKKGGNYVYPISSDCYGKIFIENTIILFQFVVPVPEPPKLRLPKSVKGSWTHHFDWNFVAIQAAVMVFGYFFFAVYIQSLPKPAPMEFVDIPNRFAKLIAPQIDMENIAEDKEVKDLNGDADGNAVASRAKKEESNTGGAKKSGKPRDASTIQREESARIAEIQSKVAGRGLLKMIGSLGSGGTGGFINDVLGDGGKGQDIDAALSGVKSIGIAQNSSQRSRKGEAGAVETAKIGDLKVEKSEGSVAVKSREEKTVVSKAAVGKTEIDGAVDSASVAKTIRASSSAVKRCYDKALLLNPTLKGKVSVTILINERGRVESIEISEDTVKDAEVTKCIKGVIKGLRFPKPEGGMASVTFPFVFTN